MRRSVAWRRSVKRSWLTSLANSDALTLQKSRSVIRRFSRTVL